MAAPTHGLVPAVDAAAIVERLRMTFQQGRTRPLGWRRRQLSRLREMLVEQEADFAAALRADLGKNPTECYLTELSAVINEIDHIQRNLHRWLRAERAQVPVWLRPATARVVREPLGVVLVIAPWNYPLQLLLAPLAGALAAGNCAVVKPSEVAPATSAAIARQLPRYTDRDAVRVVEGTVPETTALLEQRFDHIFYTGGATVGRVVLTAAARHLTPVTLELGGKSPVIVDRDTDLDAVARRIAFGKFLNAGQTCVAPDYLLAEPEVADRLEPRLAAAVRAFYGRDPAASPDYGHIVSERHFDRLAALLGDGRVVTGGDHDRSTRYIAPTVLRDVDPMAPIMQDEIFGPILPILRVPGLDAALAFVNERPKPLALYAFTRSERTKARILAETSAGAVGFDIPLAHLLVPTLPFGGVGDSGMGAYHGRYSVETFSHRKAILDKPQSPDTLRFVYPPYSKLKDRLLRRLL